MQATNFTDITHQVVIFPPNWAKTCVEEAVNAPSCPQCGSRDVSEFDCGTDPDTGYNDSGLICNDCEEVF